MLALRTDSGEAFLKSRNDDVKLFIVQAQQFQHRGMQVMHMHPFLNRPPSNFVSGADDFSTLDPASCHPGRKAVGMVIPSSIALHDWRAAELARRNNQGVLQ